MKRPLALCSLFIVFCALPAYGSADAPVPGSVSSEPGAATYWTPERLRSAKPMPMPDVSAAPTSTVGGVSNYVDLSDAPTITVDWSKGNMQAVTLGGNRSFMFSNGQKGGRYTLIIKQDVTGSRTVTWPSSVHWPGRDGPTLTTTAGKRDYIGFIYKGDSYDMLSIAQGY